MNILEQLIRPNTKEHFFQQYWTKNELQLVGNFEPEAFFSLCELNDLLNIGKEYLAYPDVRMIKQGKVIPESRYTTITAKKRKGSVKSVSLDKILEFCNAGATLAISGVNNFSNKLYNLATDLENAFQENVQINCYLSQKGKQGFDPHFDHHEIIILQVQGTKAWTIYGDADVFPLATDNWYDQGTQDFANQRKYKLSPGDMLYIPRGMWHEAIAEDSSSLHLTVNIYCKTNLDFIHWYLDGLAKDEVILRQNFNSKTCSQVLNDFVKKRFGEEALSQKHFEQLNLQFNQEKKLSHKIILPFNS